MRLTELARSLGCELRGDGDVEVVDVASVEDAPPGTLTFLADRRLATKLAGCRAAAVILPLDAPDVALPSLRAAQPYVAFVAAVELFHPPPPRPARVDPSDGRHRIDCTSRSGRVGRPARRRRRRRVTIGRDATLHARGHDLRPRPIGDAFTAHAGAVVREGARIGDRVVSTPARSSAATGSGSSRSRTETGRSRRSAPSSSRTTSRSARTPPSTAPRSARP
jgi:UDP-3-O-[3-hydroxymyristoyl] glucosamine N-acyltransferase